MEYLNSAEFWEEESVTSYSGDYQEPFVFHCKNGSYELVPVRRFTCFVRFNDCGLSEFHISCISLLTAVSMEESWDNFTDLFNICNQSLGAALQFLLLNGKVFVKREALGATA